MDMVEPVGGAACSGTVGPGQAQEGANDVGQPAGGAARSGTVGPGQAQEGANDVGQSAVGAASCPGSPGHAQEVQASPGQAPRNGAFPSWQGWMSAVHPTLALSQEPPPAHEEETADEDTDAKRTEPPPGRRLPWAMDNATVGEIDKAPVVAIEAIDKSSEPSPGETDHDDQDTDAESYPDAQFAYF